MRALSVQEIDEMIVRLKPLIGARLQEEVVGPTGVGLGLWTKSQGLSWLWFEAHHWFPLLVPLNRPPENGIQPLKPLALFLRAHFRDHVLISITRNVDLGRALTFTFAKQGEECECEIRLWPRGGNLIVRARGKQVSWERISEIKNTATNTTQDLPHCRSLEEIHEAWLELRQQRKDTPQQPSQKDSKKQEKEKSELSQQKAIAKLQKAVAKVDAELKSKQSAPWRLVAQDLLSAQTTNLEGHSAVSDWPTYVDRRRSLAWNIENCFQRAKEQERKVLATTERLEDLRRQISQIEKGEWPVKKSARPEARSKPKTASRFRTIDLGEGVTAKLGKSAADNMNLLRAAKAWDYWLHLKDFPGSHAIITRAKNQKISESDLQKAGLALAEQSLGKSVQAMSGEKLVVVVTETRHVKPIKGDRLGRVTYHEARTFLIRLP